MAEWKEYKVSGLLDSGALAIGDGYRAKNSQLSNVGVPFARAGNINEGFNFVNADFFPVEGISKVGEKISRVGDIVFTSKGTVGRFAFVDDLAPQFVYSPQLCYWRSLNKNLIHPRFLFYWMQGKEFYSQVDAVKGQTDMADYVSLTDQRQMKITLPSLPEQQAIAEVLSSLDDKIDLLHRQNKTLEALAETLFRQWFVEEAEESWASGKVEDLFILQRGFDLPAQNRSEGQYPILSASGITGYHNEFKVRGAGVTTGRSGLLGKVFYVPDKFWPLNTSLFINEYKLAKPLFAYFFLKTLDLAQLNGGSAVPTLNRNDVHAIDYDLPPKRKIDNFEEMAKTHFEKITSNINQIRTLTKLRDSLLPKLMSGEMRVDLSKTESATANQ